MGRWNAENYPLISATIFRNLQQPNFLKDSLIRG